MPHGPERIAFSTDGFSVVVVRHPRTGLWLAVNETKGRGWWLPAGHVDRGQTFIDAALAETREEAGINVKLKGLLAVEHSLTSDSSARMRVVFFAVPEDDEQRPKSVPDSESLGAQWMSMEELRSKKNIRPPEGLRGNELLHWAQYIEAGGAIAPIEMLQLEHDGPRKELMQLANQTIALPSCATTIAAAGPSDLCSCIEMGDVERARLAASPSNVNAIVNPEKLWTPLHVAVSLETAAATPLTQLLLIARSDPNARTHKGRTPLHFALCRGQVDIVRLLLLAGADPMAQDAQGKTTADHMQPLWESDPKSAQRAASLLQLAGGAG